MLTVRTLRPLVAPLRERVDRLTILEKVEVPRGDLRPAVEAPDVLPRCQVALVTATSLANRTADGLLGACAGCRGVALVGASTPLLPVVFASTAVTLLSGIVVTNPQGILRVVSEGGGMRFFGPHIRKVNLPLEGARP